MSEDEKAPRERAPEGPRHGSLVDYPAADASEPANRPALTLTADEDPLTRQLETIPASAGVYLLKDRAGKVLYVGKAKSLRPRVRAYFRGSDGEQGDGRFQVRFLMRRVRSFETIVTASEKEALILNNTLSMQY